MEERDSAVVPSEIQRIIFEIAAKLDGRCAYRLILVAKYVHDWIYPILCERIVLRDEKVSASLLDSIQAYEPSHFFSLTKSITVGRHIPLKLIKPLFMKLSKGIISFTIFRDIEDPDHLLKYVRSPFIRRLTLVYHNVQRTYGLAIPVEILTSISHLALITNASRGGFNIDPSIEIASAIQRNDTNWLDTYARPRPSLSPFHRLTFIAISYERWQSSSRILTLAQHLKCFAVLLPSSLPMKEINQRIQVIRRTSDPRVVVITRYGSPAEWSIDDGFAPSKFWSNIEDLSRNRCICDDGERWKDDIINDFRNSHPEISLLGD